MEVLICIALYVCHVKLDEIELNGFFKTLQQHDDIFLKKVFVGGIETSINDFFNVRDAKGLRVDDSWPITKKNESEVSHLLNIVMSCEYSSLIRRYITLVDDDVDKCLVLFKGLKWKDKSILSCQKEVSHFKETALSKTHHCYKKILDNLYKPIVKNMFGMIFVLSRLQMQSKNDLSKKRDVLKIMITMYAWLDRDAAEYPLEYNKNAFLVKLKSIKTNNSQIRFYLEQFENNNCSNFPVADVNHRTDSNAVPTYNRSRTKTETTDKFNEKKPIIYDSFMTTFKFFVFSPNDECHMNIIAFIENESDILKKDIGSSENWSSLSDELKIDIDFRHALDYELLLLQLITKTITSIVFAKLKYLTTESTGLTNIEKHAECVVSLHDVLRDYIIRFKADDQPLYLIDKMILINQKVWSICYRIKSTDVTIQESVDADINLWQESTVKFRRKLTDLKTALLMLSEHPICSKLHPSISNVHLGQVYYYDTIIFKYMVDFKHVHQQLPVIEGNKTVLCSEIDRSQKLVNSIKRKISHFGNFTKPIEPEDESTTTSCYVDFNIFHIKCMKLQATVSYIVETFFPGEGTEWQKMHLLLNFNMDIVELYHSDASGEQEWMNTQRKQSLLKLFSDMMNFFKFQSHIYCGKNKSFLKKGVKYVAKKPLSLLTGNNEKKNKDDSEILDTVAEATSVDIYQKYFKCFVEFTDHVSEYYDLDEQFRLYWDGGQKSILESNSSLKNYTFDLQDGYYLQDFIVKWILSVAYTRIRDIIDVMVFYEYKLTAADVNVLTKCLKSAYENLPLFVFEVTEYVFNRFLVVVTDFDGINKDELKNFKTLLESQLDLIGIVPDSISSELHFQIVSKLINSLKMKIRSLVKIYREKFDYYSDIDDVLKTLGLRK